MPVGGLVTEAIYLFSHSSSSWLEVVVNAEPIPGILGRSVSTGSNRGLKHDLTYIFLYLFKFLYRLPIFKWGIRFTVSFLKSI